MSDFESLIEISREYGSDSSFVLLGGGNTSLKEDGVMYVKASGTALGTIDKSGFVRMSLESLSRIWEKKYPDNSDERESMVLSDMMASRLEGETARPSVEALLHSFIPYRFVVHLHPALVNGMTCGVSGEAVCRNLFPDALWIPIINPGYILANDVRVRALESMKISKPFPKVIFLQNHGVFAGSDTLDGIRAIYSSIMDTLGKTVKREPQMQDCSCDAGRSSAVSAALEKYFGSNVTVVSNRELTRHIDSIEAFGDLSSAYTPDHIVYSGFAPLWIPYEKSQTEEGILSCCSEYEKNNGVKPKVVVVEKLAAFASSPKAALLFKDTIKVAVYSQSFGGHRFMDKPYIDFIRTWEVEKYRSSQSR